MEYSSELLDQNIALALVIKLGVFFITLLIVLDLARLSNVLFYKQGKPVVSIQEKKASRPKAMKIKEGQVKEKNRWKEVLGIYGLGFGGVVFYFLYVFLFNRRFPISMLGLLYLTGLTFLIITFLILADSILRKFRREGFTRKGLWRIFICELIILITMITVYLLN